MKNITMKNLIKPSSSYNQDDKLFGICMQIQNANLSISQIIFSEVNAHCISLSSVTLDISYGIFSNQFQPSEFNYSNANKSSFTDSTGVTWIHFEQNPQDVLMMSNLIFAGNERASITSGALFLRQE
mmetsp:Transcript_39329/g.35023  ORF Transcript_39329/g.35023 Transcript_39329/m.35023 type:complete len:127 (-) Transcript_39329:1635-2015(-)|eukprot:CAMPEP_0114592056 /NCGR_PEP_ID=MMETSP0125-20121206/13977_1 /TAXON_ID=485358 ORGANISM="Aristerostoma sp., Strain ATCC 50986" /NCGR_SAMPLE_ID=MMETSP0125 /ASSEMBLY_ACC=CAM_ASM_000245 /LENGTH=126 /DNA_ID=CAMNT_0001790507 /DNA_START=479 /DNA_END=859 /DNA_ORIENTATION=-